MSIENETKIVPSEEELIETPRGNSWRLSGGKVVRGREATGVEERKNNRVYGLVKRIGIHEGTGKDDGRKFSLFEIEVEHPEEGMVSVHASLLDQKERLAPSVSAVSLAESALQVDPGDLIVISCYLGNAKDADKKPTIATIDKVDPATRKMNRIVRKYDPADKRTTDQRWLAMEPEIRAHPLFAERPAGNDEDSHLGLLSQECAAKGWPTPQQAPAEWLQIVDKYYKRPASASVSAVSDDEWGVMRQETKELAKMPAILATAAERLATQPAAAAPKEDDPFA